MMKRMQIIMSVSLTLLLIRLAMVAPMAMAMLMNTMMLLTVMTMSLCSRWQRGHDNADIRDCSPQCGHADAGICVRAGENGLMG